MKEMPLVAGYEDREVCLYDLTLLAILHCRLRHRTRLRLETESIVKTL